MCANSANAGASHLAPHFQVDEGLQSSMVLLPGRGRFGLLLLSCVLLCAGKHTVLCERQLKQSSLAAPSEANTQPKLGGQLSPSRIAAYNTYEDYALYTKGYHYDEEDGELYFNENTGTRDEVYGDYFYGTPQEQSTCKLGPKGKIVLDGAYKKMCDIQLTGANKHVPLLNGGLDGIYKVFTCENGRPAFKRQRSPPGEDRLLWYSARHKDWDISNGTKAQEADILLYGGEGAGDLRPEFVGKDKWFIATDFQPDEDISVDYAQADVLLQCTNKHKAVPVSEKRPELQQRPYMTPQEMENQYRSVIKKAAANQQAAVASSGGSFGLSTILLLVAVGAAVCIFGPRALADRHLSKRRRGDSKGGWVGLTQLGGSRPAED